MPSGVAAISPPRTSAAVPRPYVRRVAPAARVASAKTAALGSSALTMPPRGQGRPPGSVGRLARPRRGAGSPAGADGQALEERALRRPVRVERPVELQVLVGQVREDGHVVGDLADPLEREPVRGGLDDGRIVAGGAHRGQGALQLGCLRGRHVGRRARPVRADLLLGRAQQARPQARRLQGGHGHGGGRRLAVRPGDADDAQPGCRIGIPPGRDGRERELAAIDHQLDRRAGVPRATGAAPPRARRRRPGPRRPRRHGHPRAQPGTATKQPPGTTRRES
jgi:hypothetical protein